MQMIERHLPKVAGIVGFWIAWRYLGSWQSALEARGLEFDRLLDTIFGMSLFFAGTLFTVYVIALSRPDGFLGSMLKTEAFQRFHRYVEIGLVGCAATAVVSAWFFVTGFGDLSAVVSLVFASSWLGLVFATAVCVTRVIWLFMAVVRVGTKRPLVIQTPQPA